MKTEDVTYKAIGERLEVTRKALGYETQASFAASLGRDIVGRDITPQRLNNYVSGRERLTVNVALKICARYPLTLDWLYRGDPSGLPVRLARVIENEIGSQERVPTPPRTRKTKNKNERRGPR